MHPTDRHGSVYTTLGVCIHRHVHRTVSAYNLYCNFELQADDSGGPSLTQADDTFYITGTFVDPHSNMGSIICAWKTSVVSQYSQSLHS